jgi:hypothetical protein
LTILSVVVEAVLFVNDAPAGLPASIDHWKVSVPVPVALPLSPMVALNGLPAQVQAADGVVVAPLVSVQRVVVVAV